jgi:hypothetical protein
MSKTLKLRAESPDDIPIISSTLQDAILRVGEIQYNQQGRALTLRLTRFRHETDNNTRILTGLRIDGILALKAKNIDRSDPKAMAVLLSISFDPDDTPPGGKLRLVFAGGGELLAEIEALSLILADVSDSRKTDKLPMHPLDS